jgi:hypothetical protein
VEQVMGLGWQWGLDEVNLFAGAEGKKGGQLQRKQPIEGPALKLIRKKQPVEGLIWPSSEIDQKKTVHRGAGLAQC